MNNVEAARAATQHLLDLGRRRIAVIGAHEGETVGSAALRVQGYRLALEEAGLTVDPALIGEAGLWHRATGAETMHRLLDVGRRDRRRVRAQRRPRPGRPARAARAPDRRARADRGDRLRRHRGDRLLVPDADHRGARARADRRRRPSTCCSRASRTPSRAGRSCRSSPTSRSSAGSRRSASRPVPTRGSRPDGPGLRAQSRRPCGASSVVSRWSTSHPDASSGRLSPTRGSSTRDVGERTARTARARRRRPRLVTRGDQRRDGDEPPRARRGDVVVAAGHRHQRDERDDQVRGQDDDADGQHGLRRPRRRGREHGRRRRQQEREPDRERCAEQVEPTEARPVRGPELAPQVLRRGRRTRAARAGRRPRRAPGRAPSTHGAEERAEHHEHVHGDELGADAQEHHDAAGPAVHARGRSRSHPGAQRRVALRVEPGERQRADATHGVDGREHHELEARPAELATAVRA